MKNVFLIWNAVLSIVVAFLLFWQFGYKKKNVQAVKNVSKDTTLSHQFRIAYFEMDSVEANFNLVKEVKAEIIAKETEYKNSINYLDQIFKSKYDSFMLKSNTEQEKEAAQNSLDKFGETLKNQKQDIEQKYQDFAMRKNLDVKKKIEDYLKIFNSENNYSYIISYEQGLFYYKDTAYNITDDLIKGLNDYYKHVKK